MDATLTRAAEYRTAVNLSSPDAPLRALLLAVCSAVEERADELTELDRAIGDADHGINMRRGFAAVAAKVDALAAMPIGQATSELGKTLVMTVGGASGPLYGTLFMKLGAELPAGQPMTRAALARASRQAMEAVQARGKATRGQKTLLDVVGPLCELLEGDAPLTPGALVACVHDAAQATIALRAEKGRASFLGERSVGHLDPGARSTEIIVTALADAWQAGAFKGIANE